MQRMIRPKDEIIKCCGRDSDTKMLRFALHRLSKVDLLNKLEHIDVASLEKLTSMHNLTIEAALHYRDNNALLINKKLAICQLIS